jgi:hypothetical protein
MRQQKNMVSWPLDKKTSYQGTVVARALSRKGYEIDSYMTEKEVSCLFRRCIVKKKERGRNTPSLPKKERMSHCRLRVAPRPEDGGG